MSTVDLLAYYYPQWHPDPVNDRLHGPGWTEWDLLFARSRKQSVCFPGHQPPGRPSSGPADESDPRVAAEKIRAAESAGLTGFVVDWHWYQGAPFLDGFLDRGLLPSLTQAGPSFRFALMWANHPWLDVFPAQHRHQRVLMAAPRGGSDFEAATEHVIDRYLTHPAYWRIDGLCYFSFFDVPRLVHEFGSVSRTRAALERFRERARRAGADLHLNLCANGFWRNEGDVFSALGADSVTHYNWTLAEGNGTDGHPASPYTRALAQARRRWSDAPETYHLPYIPNVTVGWDPTPQFQPWDHDRRRGLPHSSVITERSPALFGAALNAALEVAPRVGPGAVVVNAWNEWTKGSYLEADEHGTPYLDEIRRVRAVTAPSARRARRHPRLPLLNRT